MKLKFRQKNVKTGKTEVDTQTIGKAKPVAAPDPEQVDDEQLGDFADDLEIYELTLDPPTES